MCVCVYGKIFNMLLLSLWPGEMFQLICVRASLPTSGSGARAPPNARGRVHYKLVSAGRVLVLRPRIVPNWLNAQIDNAT